MARFRNRFEEQLAEEAEDFYQSLVGPPSRQQAEPPRRGVSGESTPADLFDAVIRGRAAPRGFTLQALAESPWEVVGAPGSSLLSPADVRNGDHIVRRGLGEGRLGVTRTVGVDIGIEALFDSSGRVRPDTLVLRGRGQAGLDGISGFEDFGESGPSTTPRTPTPTRRTTPTPSSSPRGSTGSTPTTECSVWLPAATSTSYTDWVAAPTKGRISLLINGRSSNGTSPDLDRTEPLERMERAVKALGSGDLCYLSAWFFEPATELRTGAYSGETTWGGLFGKKAGEGVQIRILINDFDPFSGLDAWLRSSSLVPLEALVRALPAAARRRFKYVVSRHPASYGGARAAAIRALHGGGSGPIFIGSHHQKFMVTRRGHATTAFCGGLDIESRKVPSAWSYGGLIGWHDLTLELEGPITRDIERQFVERWNRESGGARNALLPDWGSFGTLSQPATLHADDDTAAKKVHSVQLTRTISSGATFSAYSTDRRDVRQAYTRIIECASSFLYLENQYFRDLSLADELAARGRRVPGLRAIFVVLANAAADDGTNPLTSHGDGLQSEFFTRVSAGLGTRLAVYTMFNRSVHSKMAMADDRFMSVGSANANVRSFELDSELNVTVDDPTWARAARVRLWSHNLGVAESTVGSWAATDFITRWNAVATANAALTSRLPDMAGEGIVQFDWRANPGSRSSFIPDYLVRLDVAPAPRGLYGPRREGPAFPVRGGGNTAIA